MLAERIKEIKEMSLGELKTKAKELLDSAWNETIWMLGSDDSESKIMHYNNRGALLEEYWFVNDLVEQAENDKEK